MAVPLRQSLRVAAYLARQRLAGREKFPLLVELEPLYQCNLACAGCGKIQHPDHVLRRRMPVEQAVAAIEECGAPMVSIAGGEPLIHPEIDVMTSELIRRRRFVYLCTNAILMKNELEVDQMMISPAYAYEKAPDQDHFLGVEQTRKLFREAFADGRRKRWRLNHTPLYLDFLEGKVDYQCTAWGIPSYSIFGWQRPCYLMADGYANTYKELVETTDWEKYGRGRDPRCDNCMAHCGYEPTAVLATTRSFKQALRAMAAR